MAQFENDLADVMNLELEHCILLDRGYCGGTGIMSPTRYEDFVGSSSDNSSGNALCTESLNAGTMTMERLLV